ncbi:MAG: hypothetical protein ABI903_12530 [Actinomycetota bacterium]
MSKSSHVHTIRLPLRKIGSAIPAVALIGGAMMLPASTAPGVASHIGLVSSSSPALVVPNNDLTFPGSSQDTTDPAPEVSPRAPASQPPASLLPAGTVPDSASPVTLDTSGIPVRALDGYRQAARLISVADPACHLDWPLLGAIGRVESNHARFGGNQLDSAGVARPGIIGIPLDGSNGTARIMDTDHGLLDRDTTYDRAVGPMQFIPGTWNVSGVDANGDGVKDPQNMSDAATAAGVYLCSGSGDLRSPTSLRSAILRYNASDSYATMVTAIADAYRHGVRALPASDLAPAQATPVALRTTAMVKKGASPASGKAAASRPAPSPAKATTPKPVVTPWPSVTLRPTPAPTTTTPTLPPPTPSPTSTTSAPPSQPAPVQPTPTITCVPVPSATGTASPTATPSPDPAQTCLPPCAPDSAASPTATATPSPDPAQTCLPPCTPVSTISPTAPAVAEQPCVAATAGP